MSAGDSGRPFVGNFLVDLAKSKEAMNITKPTLYFTTKENSYGATMNRWFEGKAEPFIRLKRGKYRGIKITGVKRFEYLNDKCSKESFYQCMSNRLKKSHKCGEKCTLRSLPDYNYNECNSTRSQLCQY